MQREAWGEAGAVCGGEWAPFEAISRPGEGGGKSGVEGEISGGCGRGGIGGSIWGGGGGVVAKYPRSGERAPMCAWHVQVLTIRSTRCHESASLQDKHCSAEELTPVLRRRAA